MQKNLIKTAKIAGITLVSVVLVAGWLKLHDDFQKFPKGAFWDPPAKEYNQPFAGGHKEKQALFDSLKLRPDTINKK